MRGRGMCREGISRMSHEGRRIWSIEIGCATSSINTSSFTLLMILWTFLTPLILIWQLTHYDSHTALRQYPTPHRVKSLNQVQVLFLAQLSSARSKYLTILITKSGFVSYSHQGLDHFDYIIRVCSSYFIKLTSAQGLKG